MVTPRPHTELEGVGLCVHTSKGHRPYAPVQVGDVVLSFPFRPMGAEGGPNKVLLSSRPSYHHGPHHFCPAGEALCPQVCRCGPPSPLPLFWFLAAFALGPQGSCLQSSHSICPCGHWQPGPGLMSWVIGFVFPWQPVEQRVQWHTGPSLGWAVFKPVSAATARQGGRAWAWWGPPTWDHLCSPTFCYIAGDNLELLILLSLLECWNSRQCSHSSWNTVHPEGPGRPVCPLQGFVTSHGAHCWS